MREDWPVAKTRQDLSPPTTTEKYQSTKEQRCRRNAASVKHLVWKKKKEMIHSAHSNENKSIKNINIKICLLKKSTYYLKNTINP